MHNSGVLRHNPLLAELDLVVAESPLGRTASLVEIDDQGAGIGVSVGVSITTVTVGASYSVSKSVSTPGDQ